MFANSEKKSTACSSTPPKGDTRGGPLRRSSNPLWDSLALRPAALQPKLAVSNSDDLYEREADRMADRVIGKTASSAKVSPPSAVPLTVQGKCSRCTDEEKAIRRGQTSAPDPPKSAAALVQQPPSPSSRQLGRSLSATFGDQGHGIQLAVNTTATARRRGKTSGGRPQVHGVSRDIDEREDRFLVGHEFAHAIQQNLGSALPDQTIASARQTSLEAEADRAGSALVRGIPFQITERAPKAVSLFSGTGHRIEAVPNLAQAMPGTKIHYYFTAGNEIGGKYSFQWWVENDPKVAKLLNKPLVVKGPTEESWDLVGGFPGRHKIICEVTDENYQTRERLEFVQLVLTEKTILDDAFSKSQTAPYDVFRGKLELQNLQFMQGGLRDQSAGKTPAITSSGRNPSTPGIAPNHAYYTYTVHPSPGAKKFHWYARPHVWGMLPSENYHGFKKVSINGVDVYDLGSEGPNATFIIADARIWTIICEEFDGSGQALGTTATYRQVVQTDEESEALTKWQDYMKRSDEAAGKIAEKKELALRAVYVNRETGQTMSLPLYAGPSVADPKKIVLIDLLPSVEKVEYSGNSIDAAIADFVTNNSYPKGTIKLLVPANALGIPTCLKTFETKGESDWALWSGRVGWASLGLTVLGVIAAVIPGAQPVAAVLFIAAGATGAAAGGLSLYDRLQKAEKSSVGIALDVATIAASLIGAAGAVRALRTGSQALALAGTTGKFLLYSGFVTNTVSGLVISVEGIDQIVKILDSPMSRSEKISAIVRVLGTLIVTGVLFALSVREIKQMRTRVSGFLGKELTGQLDTTVLHSLNLLDDKALKALAGQTAEQLTQVAKLARVDPKLANRLASMEGVSLSAHDLTIAGTGITVDGQINLAAGKLAAMSDEEVKQLMQVSKALKAAQGDTNLLSAAEKKFLKTLSESKGPRLRFEVQLKQVDQFLTDVGAAADPRGQKLFTNLSESERRRLYDLVNAKRGGVNLVKQASSFALGGARSVAEYVELFEAYVANYNKVVKARLEAYIAALKTKMSAALGANPSASAAEKAKLEDVVDKEFSKATFGEEILGTGDRLKMAITAKVEKDLGIAADPTKAGAGAKQTQATFEANKVLLKGHIGTTQIASGLTDAEAMAKVKALPEVKFASESAGNYHVEKHLKELPPSEQTGKGVTDFLASAKKTIQSGKSTVTVNQDGSRNLNFVREVEEGIVKYTLTARVNVSETGKVSLSTYGGYK